MSLGPREKQDLLDLAARAIDHGLETGRPLPEEAVQASGLLARPGACFVTLQRDGRLRGCIGSLEAHRPLAVDAADHAFNAAFRDPRFAPLEKEERQGLDIHLSVLTPPKPFPAQGREDLLARLRPGVDGLVVEEGPARATFLPSVWESLPSPEAFLAQLLAKAGLPEDYWSHSLAFKTYHVIEIG